MNQERNENEGGSVYVVVWKHMEENKLASMDNYFVSAEDAKKYVDDMVQMYLMLYGRTHEKKWLDLTSDYTILKLYKSTEN